MYLHIGGTIVVLLKEVIGIFDYSLRNNKTNKEFLESCTKSKEIVYVDEAADIKSYIVTDRRIFYSPIAASTLKKRVARGNELFIENI